MKSSPSNRWTRNSNKPTTTFKNYPLNIGLKCLNTPMNWKCWWRMNSFRHYYSSRRISINNKSMVLNSWTSSITPCTKPKSKNQSLHPSVSKWYSTINQPSNNANSFKTNNKCNNLSHSSSSTKLSNIASLC